MSLINSEYWFDFYNGDLEYNKRLVDTAKCLILKGNAHIDARNYADMTVIDIAKEYKDSIKIPVIDFLLSRQNVKLSCLALKSINKHKLHYKDVIPAHLHKYVAIH